MLLVFLFSLLIHNTFFVLWHSVRQTLTHTDTLVFVLYSLRSFWEQASCYCVQYTHLRSPRLASSFIHCMERSEWENWTVIQSKCCSTAAYPIPKANPKYMDLPRCPSQQLCYTSRLQCWCVLLCYIGNSAGLGQSLSNCHGSSISTNIINTEQNSLLYFPSKLWKQIHNVTIRPKIFFLVLKVIIVCSSCHQTKCF